MNEKPPGGTGVSHAVLRPTTSVLSGQGICHLSSTLGYRRGYTLFLEETFSSFFSPISPLLFLRYLCATFLLLFKQNTLLLLVCWFGFFSQRKSEIKYASTTCSPQPSTLRPSGDKNPTPANPFSSCELLVSATGQDTEYIPSGLWGRYFFSAPN